MFRRFCFGKNFDSIPMAIHKVHALSMHALVALLHSLYIFIIH